MIGANQRSILAGILSQRGGQVFVDLLHRSLLRAVLRLRDGIRVIQKKSCYLFKNLFPDIYRAVDAIARLQPIHFADSHLPWQSFAPVAKLDVQ